MEIDSYTCGYLDKAAYTGMFASTACVSSHDVVCFVLDTLIPSREEVMKHEMSRCIRVSAVAGRVEAAIVRHTIIALVTLHHIHAGLLVKGQKIVYRCAGTGATPVS